MQINPKFGICEISRESLNLARCIVVSTHSKQLEQLLSLLVSFRGWNVWHFGTINIKIRRSNSALNIFRAYSRKRMVENEWWKSQLSLEIHDVLRQKEARLPPFTSSSPQLKLRRFLVDWLAVISEKIKSSHGVLHLAVYYMDYFMDKFDIQEPQLHLVPLSCLLLAGKQFCFRLKFQLTLRAKLTEQGKI